MTSRYRALVEQHAALVPVSFSDWIEMHGLEQIFTPLLHTTAAWIASASPAGASEAERAIACMDLGGCFFALDDAPPDEARRRYDDLEQALSDAPDHRRPLQRAYADLFARLATMGSPMGHYRDLRRTFVCALRTRHDILAGKLRLDSERYLELRQITIYFEPWLSVWELLHGFHLSSRERADVAPALAASTRWQVLENERVSLTRDSSAGAVNVITLLAAERESSIEQALFEVQTRTDAALDELTTAARTVRSASPTPAVLRYLDAIERSVDGAIRHHRDADPGRYSSPR